MKSNSLKYIFIAIQTILYGAFLTLDVFGLYTSLSIRIKLLVVLLCFLYVLIAAIKRRSRQLIYLIYALAFTVISDIFILLLDNYLYGVLTFIIAQQFYGIRISELYSSERALVKTTNPSGYVVLRAIYQGAFTLIICTILWLSDVQVDSLLVASVFYFISLCTNVVRSVRLNILYPHRPDIRYFAIGLILFLLCDINVGLFNLSDFLTLNQAYELIYSISSILMWTFYAPSQVLIALSSDDY